MTELDRNTQERVLQQLRGLRDVLASEEPTGTPRERADLVRATMRSALQQIPPAMRGEIRDQLNRKAQRQRIANSVERRNWYKEYAERNRIAADYALEFPRQLIIGRGGRILNPPAIGLNANLYDQARFWRPQG